MVSIQTCGNTSWSQSGWATPGSGFAAASAFTWPSSGGFAKTFHGFFDTISGSGAHGWGCVWNQSTGALIVSRDIGIINNGSASAGGQQNWVSDFNNPNTYIAPSLGVYVGFYCNQGLAFSSGTGGTSVVKSMGGSGPGSISGASGSGIGVVESYIDLFSGNVYVMRAGVWQQGPARVMRSGVMQAGLAYVMRAGVMVQGG